MTEARVTVSEAVPAMRAPWSLGQQAAAVAAGLVAWGLLYTHLAAAASWLTYSALHLGPETALAPTVEFFLYEAPKVLLLLTLVVFGVGIVRSFFTPERTRRILAGKHAVAGNGLAGLLGVVTPFCSCSAVPLFIGFVTTGVPLGVTFSFLISAPMVNEVALVLLFGLFGWRIAALYLATGLAIAIVAGWVIGRLHLEGWVEPWVYRVQAGTVSAPEERRIWADRVRSSLGTIVVENRPGANGTIGSNLVARAAPERGSRSGIRDGHCIQSHLAGRIRAPRPLQVLHRLYFIHPRYHYQLSNQNQFWFEVLV